MDSSSDSDSDDDVLAYRQAAKEMLDTSRVKRLHRDWEAASRLRHSALLLLSEASPRYSIPRVRFDINNVTDDTCVLFYHPTPSTAFTSFISAAGRHSHGRELSYVL
ncbi:hypothetical protein PHYSODRAFT_330351 [Phytophthora sojae]|uniref:Uncharacterized protein n=1 Tax=Phytophthora sojae (strain P6497) TaxID=1094619 RepID=G4Z9F8_PHYSP|nr:hypothetical protein PHYSODRAFT_330351 [Phytophthora sojae]EGZ22590.1 hypothetical protein PHYSODRAFT_330351 [Phytophthora sojae]|eukprot:XP_009525307.1 hypothetical protein PHYSODRAFT_330351 [Phytophthora sojae]